MSDPRGYEQPYPSSEGSTMKGSKFLYKVTFGLMTRKDDCPNWRSVNVLAVNAWDAINKVKARKNEYIAEVEIIDRVDVE